MIDSVINTTDTLSSEESGTSLSEVGSKAQTTMISAQVIPTSSAAFEVELEAALMPESGSHEFTPIGSFTNTDDTYLSTFPISIHCRYRFRHVSGIECRVLMRG